MDAKTTVRDIPRHLPWLYRYKLNGKLRRINMGRYPFFDCFGAFNTYSEARTQVIGGVDVFEQLAKAKQAEQAREHVESLTPCAGHSLRTWLDWTCQLKFGID